MILSTESKIILNSKVIKWYENKGYFIPKYTDKQNRLKIKKGTSIIVKSKDLSKGSTVKVLCKCDICGKEKLIKFCFVKPHDKYFCKKCGNNTSEHLEKLSQSNKGKKLTKEHKEKISKSNKGKKLTKEHKEKISKSNKGRKYSNEIKKRMSENSYMLGKFGKLHHNWNPNKTKKERKNHRMIPGIFKWKQKILKRDNYTCQCCGSKEQLHVHHINNYNNFKEQRLNINNGITLCFNCHKGKINSIHHIFGFFTTKENLNEFMKSLFT